MKPAPRAKAGTGAFVIHELDRRSLDTAAVDDWTNACRTASNGEWFAGPQWILPLIDTYFPAHRLALQFVYCGPALVGVVPLIAESNGRRDVLGFPVNSHVRRIGAISELPLDKLFDILLPDLKRRGRAYEVAFRQLPVGSNLHDAVISSCRRSALGFFSREESRSAVADISRGWEHYVGGLAGRHLHNLRKLRKMEKSKAWSTRMFSSSDSFEDGWTALLEIERHSWKHASGTSIANEPGAAAFYSSVASSCARDGMLRLHVSYHEERPVAHTLGVVHGGTYYLLKHSYDESFKQWSPGLLLVWQVMQQCAAGGLHSFDFLGDVMSWKADFATASPAYVSITAFSSLNMRGQWNRLAETHLKPTARRLGAKAAFDRIRRGWR